MRVEIPYEDIHKVINARLRAAGIDLGKEVHRWCKWNGDKLILVYAQGEEGPWDHAASSPICTPVGVHPTVDICNRPSYLKEIK